MASILKHLLIICILAISNQLESKDLGVHGHLYSIQEEDLLEFMLQKLNSLSEEELTELQDQTKKQLIQKLSSPSSVEKIAETKTKRIFYFDPTITVNQDILDHEGHAIVRRGTSINPLEQCQLDKELLFFDSTQEKHIRWAKTFSSSAKWILVRGNPLELENEEQRAVYFDQGGVLTKKLGIENVPARVSQESLRLKITETPIDEALCERA